MNKELKCCFIGHRNIEITENLTNKLFTIITELIHNGVSNYLFGSRSNFNDLCLKIVADLKKVYPHIKRIKYAVPYEGCYLEKDKKIYNHAPYYWFYDENYEYKNKYTAGKASYIERNQAMINNSDYCIFYYDKDYLPNKRKYSKKCVFEYQPNSGTKVAYDFAQQKKKIIINTFE